MKNMGFFCVNSLTFGSQNVVYTNDQLKFFVYFDGDMCHLDFSVSDPNKNWLGILEESFNCWVLR